MAPDRSLRRKAPKTNSHLSFRTPNSGRPPPHTCTTLEVTLLDAAGETVDQVTSYAGIRTVGKIRDPQGHWRFTLNGQPIFHWGPLDQGWWPDGLLTPPSDEAMLFDIEFLKAAGFNMIRKHIKVEPRRYYYHCDRLGMMVWQDQVSGGEEPPWTRLKPDPEDAEWPDAAPSAVHARTGTNDLDAGESPVDRVLGPIQRSVGDSIARWRSASGRSKRDPTRLVNIASGGNFWPVGDVVDAHKYPHPGVSVR